MAPCWTHVNQHRLSSVHCAVADTPRGHSGTRLSGDTGYKPVWPLPLSCPSPTNEATRECGSQILPNRKGCGDVVVWSLRTGLCQGIKRNHHDHREEPLCGWETLWKKRGCSLEAEISSFLGRRVDRKTLHPGSLRCSGSGRLRGLSVHTLTLTLVVWLWGK